MRPLIGITLSIEGRFVNIGKDYSDAVLAAGGLPIMLPFTHERQTIRQIAGTLDGLLLAGGEDVDPFCYGEEPVPKLGSVSAERDQLEMDLLEEMLMLSKPILGICRGVQVLNVATGGTLIQDIESQAAGEILQHSQKGARDHVSHYAYIEPSSLLSRIVGEPKIKVNSFHHQAVKDLGPGFVVSAKASDGIVEAIESKDHPFVLGVQWHPENLYRKDQATQKLFKAFVNACSKI